MGQSTKEFDLDPRAANRDPVDATGMDTNRHDDLLRSRRRCLERIEQELYGIDNDGSPSPDPTGTGDESLRRIKRLHSEKKATLEAIEMLESRDLPPLDAPRSEPCTDRLTDESRSEDSAADSPTAQPEILKNRSPFEQTAEDVLDPLTDGPPSPRMN